LISKLKLKTECAALHKPPEAGPPSCAWTCYQLAKDTKNKSQKVFFVFDCFYAREQMEIVKSLTETFYG
jgi:hypothetical protein